MTNRENNVDVMLGYVCVWQFVDAQNGIYFIIIIIIKPE
jgi:hypothetical protein